MENRAETGRSLPTRDGWRASWSAGRCAMARTEDQPLRQVLLDHLGPEAARLPTISGSYPLWEHVNLQVGVEAWLTADTEPNA